MPWTYSGDPTSSEVDKYRFYIGDTNEKEPILQDGEIQFVVDTYTSHNMRLYQLFDAAATFFARKISRKVGPIEEKTQDRLDYFASKAAHYKSLISMASFSTPVSTKTVFTKGMHDNGGY